MADGMRDGRDEGTEGARPRESQPAERGAWDDFGIVWCDERAFGRGWVARRVERGTQPLAHGVHGRVAVRSTNGPAQEGPEAEGEEHYYNRVGALTGFGNAIVPQLAAVFITAYMDMNRSNEA
jgi:hypothetical protein